MKEKMKQIYNCTISEKKISNLLNELRYKKKALVKVSEIRENPENKLLRLIYKEFIQKKKK